VAVTAQRFSSNAYIGDKLIASKKERKCLPAEMMNLDIKKQDLIDNATGEIVIKIEQQ
jgi:hypothetical protein